jgi:hypothetical protein
VNATWLESLAVLQSSLLNWQMESASPYLAATAEAPGQNGLTNYACIALNTSSVLDIYS